jgi:tetratricopeptide (TPR) repeat protein
VCKIKILLLVLIILLASNLTFAQNKSPKLLTPKEKYIPAKKELKPSSQPSKKSHLPNPKIELVKGIKYANQKKYDEAIQIFESIIKKYPDTKVSNQAKFMIDRINEEKQRIALLSQPKPEAKIEIPKEYYPDYQFNVGLEHYRNRNFKEALICFQNVVATAPKDSILAKHAEMAIKKIKRRLTPKPKPKPIPHFKISDEKRKQIYKEWEQKILQHQQELFDKAMKLKREGKLQEALKVFEKLMDSRSSPVLDKAAKEMSKIKKELGLLEGAKKNLIKRK